MHLSLTWRSNEVNRKKMDWESVIQIEEEEEKLTSGECRAEW